jgi:hypothetical protein
MHEIEPYYRWREKYIASEDTRSPFYGRPENTTQCVLRLYNFYLHPQWDDFGSSTLYGKLLYVDYDAQYAILELIGEWNDALHNDIMFFRREVLDPMLEEGISKFILLTENVLNFHAGDDDYYAELWEELNELGGWICMLGARQQVVDELFDARLDHYVVVDEALNEIAWRPLKPGMLVQAVELVLRQKSRTISYEE